MDTGVVCFSATNYMKRALGVDDSLDVFPVHGVGGVMGTTLTGIFAATMFGGVGYAEGQTMAGQVGVQPGEQRVVRLVRRGQPVAAEHQRLFGQPITDALRAHPQRCL